MEPVKRPTQGFTEVFSGSLFIFHIYNNKEELCTKALCTYFTFSQEKAKEEMHFLNCEVEQDEIIPLI